MGKLEAVIAERGLDALAAFFHGIIGQAHNVEILDPRGADVDLDFDEVGVNAVDRSAERLKEHREGNPESAGAA
jgi:hypothetical protein